MDSLTLFGHLFKTPCEAICIFLDFFTEKRGSHREIYDFFRKSHETHCIRKRFSIYCNKNCSGNMRILCPFAEITYTPPGDENDAASLMSHPISRNNLRPVRGRKHNCYEEISGEMGNNLRPARGRKPRRLQSPTNCGLETTHTPPGDENLSLFSSAFASLETTHAPPGDENAI